MPHQITRHSARDALNVRVFCCQKKDALGVFCNALNLVPDTWSTPET